MASGEGQEAGAKVEELLASAYGRIYNLAIRMLLVPEEAEDATQDIVVKILRGLPGFRGESSFATWPSPSPPITCSPSSRADFPAAPSRPTRRRPPRMPSARRRTRGGREARPRERA